MGSQRGHDQADERRARAQPPARIGDPRSHRGDYVRDRHATLEVETWGPANLRVPHPVLGHRLDQLRGHSSEGWGRLQQPDRQVEVGEQLCLVVAAGRADEAVPRVRKRELHADLGSQRHRRLRADRSVKVLVQLRLGQRAQLVSDHVAMIGGRSLSAVLSLGLAVGASGLCFGLRAANPAVADPPVAAARAAGLVTAAAAADDAVAELELLLESAVEDARHGAALTLAGTDPPAPLLLAAADRLERGLSTVDAAGRALDMLEGVSAAIDPTRAFPQLAVDRFALTSIGSQLSASAEAATVFVQRRHAADAVLEALRGAIAALDGRDPHAALRQIDTARAALEILSGWKQPPLALAVWLRTTGELLDAAAAIASATIAGDRQALEAAGRRYADASLAARQADSALAIALAEGGSATISVPLRRLADMLASAAALRASLAGLLTGG